MPEMLYFPDDEETKPVATEQELLDFVNKGRQAGGENVLEALLPSVAANTKQCLIARGLNFGCMVYGLSGDDWGMYLPGNMSFTQARAVAEALECSLEIDDYKSGWVPATAANWTDNYTRAIRLPEHIGNAAEAFDMGVAFQNYKEGANA
jgi:hypothetical protein